MAKAEIVVPVAGIDIKLRRYRVTDTYGVSGEGPREDLEAAVNNAIQSTMQGEVDELGERPIVEKVTIVWEQASPTKVSIVYEFRGNFRGSPISFLILIIAAAITLSILAIAVGSFVLTPIARIAEEVGPIPFILGGAALLILALVLFGFGKRKKAEK